MHALRVDLDQTFGLRKSTTFRPISVYFSTRSPRLLPRVSACCSKRTEGVVSAPLGSPIIALMPSGQRGQGSHPAVSFREGFVRSYSTSDSQRKSPVALCSLAGDHADATGLIESGVGPLIERSIVRENLPGFKQIIASERKESSAGGYSERQSFKKACVKSDSTQLASANRKKPMTHTPTPSSR